MFEKLSQHIRTKRGLPGNWRVYSVEALANGKIKCVGALTRRVDPEHEPDLHRDFDWIKPLRGKAQSTISREVYEAIYAGATQ